MDISDGLAGDLKDMLNMSKVDARLLKEQIPVTKGFSLNQALSDGEDFELLFTLSKEKAKELTRKAKFKFVVMGEIVAQKEGLGLVDSKGLQIPLKVKGYKHF